MKNIYIIRKYVVASSIPDALKKEKQTPVTDCWLDEQAKGILVDAMYKHGNQNTGFKA